MGNIVTKYLCQKWNTKKEKYKGANANQYLKHLKPLSVHSCSCSIVITLLLNQVESFSHTCIQHKKLKSNKKETEQTDWFYSVIDQIKCKIFYCREFNLDDTKARKEIKIHEIAKRG